MTTFALSELYTLIRNAYGERIYIDREISNKTRDLLQKHTISGQLELPGASHAPGPCVHTTATLPRTSRNRTDKRSGTSRFA
jgi:hypothetical protein